MSFLISVILILFNYAYVYCSLHKLDEHWTANGKSSSSAAASAIYYIVIQQKTLQLILIASNVLSFILRLIGLMSNHWYYLHEGQTRYSLYIYIYIYRAILHTYVQFTAQFTRTWKNRDRIYARDSTQTEPGLYNVQRTTADVHG